jgi:pyrimidine-nucleoside phosphorylase
LIAASVMAKKLVIDADLILLDVKAGSGAFMADVADARELAATCLGIAAQAGRRAIAAITDMSQPLGTAVGNALEVAEAIDVLAGRDGGRLRETATALAARAVATLAEVPLPAAEDRAARALQDGSALAAFRRFVRAQGGDERVADNPAGVLPAAPVRLPIEVASGGWVGAVDAALIGAAASTLGAGRHRKGAPIDPAVGIVLTAKVGDRVEGGAMIGEIHARTDAAAVRARDAVLAAVRVGETPTVPPPLIDGWLEVPA